MKIGIGNDHSAVEMKQEISKYLQSKGYEIVNYGTDSTESYPYPTAALNVAHAVVENKVDCGILICGTGIGIGIAANKVKGIRAALCTNAYCAEMTRRHNNANVLCMGGKVVDVATALELVDIFFSTEFEGGRHERRIGQIAMIENGEL